MNQANKTIQQDIDNTFIKCEQLKDSIYLMQSQYLANTAYLEKLCATSGLSATAGLLS